MPLRFVQIVPERLAGCGFLIVVNLANVADVANGSQSRPVNVTATAGVLAKVVQKK